MNPTQALDNFKALFPHLEEKINNLRTNYDQKLWYQTMELLLEIVKDEQVLNNGVQIVTLTNFFAKDFCLNLDPLKYVKFVSIAARFHNSAVDSKTFLEEQREFIKDKQAILALNLTQGQYDLAQNNYEQVQKLIKETATEIQSLLETDPFVYSQLYLLNSKYFKQRNEHSEFYLNALQYLAYTREEDLTRKQKFELSLEMAFAILISPKIYNFSELLQQDILISLKSSEFNWIYTLLETFNKGDVAVFNQNIQQFQQQLNGVEILKNNAQVLQDKIKIMALLDLIFNLPKNERVLSFDQVSRKCQVDINTVEFLVMKSFSLELIKGSIDQITQQVTITWIIPRVLNIERLQTISQKFSTWQSDLQSLTKSMNQYAFLQDQL